MDVLSLLLKSKLRSFGINKLKNFVSTLFHHGNFWEVLVSHDDERSFKVEVDSGLKTPGLESDVRKDGRGKSIRVKVLDLAVVELEPRVNVAGSFVRILVVIKVELSELSHVPPAVVVD